jgi:LysR family glycine cleavage system transcriptional activator
MKSNIPPFAALVAFEAAGRMQSFTKAAGELNVTQAAISRQIRLLEEYLGRPLFVRAHRAVHLTVEGRDYLHTVVNALTHVGTATGELIANSHPQRLTIAADQSMAALWLMPRLKAVRDMMASAALRLVVDDADEKCLAGDVDVALIHGDGNWITHDSALLFAEEVTPVCSPSFFAGRKPPEDPQDLACETLIDLEDEHWNWLNWRQWLTSHGVSMATGPRSLTILSYPHVIEAARRGLGLALGWRGLVDGDIAAGTLTTVLSETLRTRFGYHVAWPRNRAPSPETRRFIDWALGQRSIAGDPATSGSSNRGG